jgi:hypothetical protein
MKTTLKIRFCSGREEKYTAEFMGGGGAGMRAEEFLENPTLALRTADELLIFPASAIECISISLPRESAQTFDLSNIRRAERIS